MIEITAVWTSAIELRKTKQRDIAFDRWLARFLHIDVNDVLDYLRQHETEDVVQKMLAQRRYG